MPMARCSATPSGKIRRWFRWAWGPRTDYVTGFARGGYELSDGTPIRMRPWYRAGLRDLNVTLLTSITPDFGVMWGMGLGDRGPKYRINPSLRLGLIWQTRVGRDSWLTLRATTDLGGRIRERPCTADYGDLGGVQPVNCRLAASPCRPIRRLICFLMKIWGEH
ncbi:hypothetical protein ACFSHQ_11075 [Gemmobacter lanyuensis]